MVLKGGEKGFGIPLNAPLYPSSTATTRINYSRVRVALVLANVDPKSVDPLLPEGVEFAYYIPYIYVTNDAGMAAGRELAGAPKKLGDIKLVINDYGLVIGTLDRGGELMRVEVAISNRLGLEQLDTFKALMLG
ncbi:acetoacetate decarboxylase family protein [Vulcanisaeta sp. JCM 14467]|uniref:acetoacetate decarboxylase family protein n=1 Tax=Vulcanisaeta sp. JCM 14467 TaxID=1295370 RepID=UPI000A42820A|nr:acetoacetate decarboxylase family protein [Vulcanisaeta sp. JCM 14467]